MSNIVDADKPLYTGVVLDEMSAMSLRSAIEAMGLNDEFGWQTSNIAAHGNEQLNHHMTITVGALNPDHDLQAMMGDRITLAINGWGIDESLGVAAWRVVPRGPAGYVKSGSPHITAMLRDSSVKPFLAAKIKKWIPFGIPISVTGTLQEVYPLK